MTGPAEKADSPLPRHLLPPSLLQIAEYCGEETMWAIWGAYGGGHLSVPFTVAPEHRLVELLGIINAERFCDNFGGELLNIPMAKKAKDAVRNQRIRQMKNDGIDNFSLHCRFGLTERRIISICNEEAQTIQNFDLFE